MTIRVYDDKTVKVITKTSHGVTKVQEIVLDTENQHPTEKWVAVGEQFEVPTQDVRHR